MSAAVKTATPGTAKRKLSRYLYFGLVLLVIFLFAGIRYRLRSMPLERDEGEYAYTGQLILQGIPPYQLAYTMKLPGTAASYAVLEAVLGQTPSRIHLGLLLVNALTTLLVFWLGWRLFGWLAGVVACASYALCSANPLGLGLAGHASHFVVLPTVAGVLALLDAVESNRSWKFFCSGLLLGLAFVMKQPGVLFLLFGMTYLLLIKLRRPLRWKALGSSLGLLALAGVLPFAATCLAMWKTGVFQKFWFWTFTYVSQYASRVTMAQAFGLLQIILPHVVGPVLLIWLIAGVGLTAFLWCSRARAHGVFAGLFLLFSILAVCPGLYFREHYFILMLPALSLLAGLAVSCASRRLWERRRSLALAAMPALLFLAAFVFTIYQQRQFFFRMTPLAVTHQIYGSNPFPEALDIARFVAKHTSTNTPLAILGSEPEIYFYSRRHSATGYIYTYELMEPQKYASRMQNEMITEIAMARPEVIIYVDIPLSWLPAPGADMYIFDWIKTYLEQNYSLAGIGTGAHPESPVDTQGIAEPLSTWNIYIFKRKAP
jgi:Dolichyl-phosphate-mannose-protein mannosyltransferase